MSSSIPNAIQQFIAIATTALPNSPSIPTQVWFGKPLPRYIAPVTLQITGVTGQQDPAELGPTYRREEKYNLNCLLTTWAGDDNHLQGMLDAFGYFALITVAVANNPTLNSAVRFAQPRSLGYTPDADPSGKRVGTLAFTLACEARVTSLT